MNRLISGIFAATVCTLITTASAVEPGDRAESSAVKSAMLDQALLDFSRRTGIQIIFKSELTRGLMASQARSASGSHREAKVRAICLLIAIMPMPSP